MKIIDESKKLIARIMNFYSAYVNIIFIYMLLSVSLGQDITEKSHLSFLQRLTENFPSSYYENYDDLIKPEIIIPNLEAFKISENEYSKQLNIKRHSRRKRAQNRPRLYGLKMPNGSPSENPCNFRGSISRLKINHRFGCKQIKSRKSKHDGK